MCVCVYNINLHTYVQRLSGTQLPEAEESWLRKGGDGHLKR